MLLNSMPTVLITGTSSGIGHATAELFAEKGWQVLAGSRHPENVTFSKEGIEPVAIDVNSPVSIAACFQMLQKQNMSLDCVVNNAGWGCLLPFEDTPPTTIQEMFRTNVFGLMEVCRLSARKMREQRRGTIITISSIVGQIGYPFYSVYVSTKWAVEGFSESLAYELRPFGIRVKIVEPGGVKTHFHKHAYDPKFLEHVSAPYQDPIEQKMLAHDASAPHYSDPRAVAAVILKAAEDESFRIRYPAGRDAAHLLRWKSLLPREVLSHLLYRRMMGKK